MDPLVAALDLQPLAALLILVVIVGGIVAWQLARLGWRLGKLDSRISYLLECSKENKKEHDELWNAVDKARQELADVKQAVARLEGRLNNERK